MQAGEGGVTLRYRLPGKSGMGVGSPVAPLYPRAGQVAHAAAPEPERAGVWPPCAPRTQAHLGLDGRPSVPRAGAHAPVGVGAQRLPGILLGWLAELQQASEYRGRWHAYLAEGYMALMRCCTPAVGGRLLSVTNAVEAGAWRQGGSG